MTYIGLGRDATVSYPTLDLVVRNSRAFPVVMVAGVAGANITVSFWGRRTVAREVRLWAEELNLEPARCVVEEAAGLAAGEVEVVKQPFDGRDVRLWRQVAEGGQVVRRELIWVDHYEPLTGLIRVGPQPAVAPAGLSEPAGSAPELEPETSDPERPGR